jgi:hypothetical protein
MEKKITDKLIVDMLEKRGYLDYRDMDENKAWSLLEKHYDCEVTDQWGRNTHDFYCYSETTADGYELFVATHDPNSVCISEDVHYYENDLQKEIERAIQDGNSMYIDDLDWHPFMHAVEACYDSMYDDIRKEVENELIEQGYEYEDADEAIA